MIYQARALDAELASAMEGLPAVSIDGAKGVGKTATASRLARTTIELDDPDQAALLALNPGRLDTDPAPILLDEWQRFPRVWDLARRAVDRDARPGRFILTGSATPSEPVHSGAGRIVRLRMRPMGLAERGLERPTVSIAELLAGGQPPIDGRSALGIRDYAEEITRSGFPAIRRLEGRHRVRALDGYIASLTEHDFAELGHVVRRPAALLAWLQAFAAATATTATYETILAAATPGTGDKPARSTAIAYRDVLTRLWVLDQVPAWTPTRNRLSALIGAPKHFLADPALAARLLGVGADALVEDPRPGKPAVRDGRLFGALFEALVALTVRVHAELAGARVRHLRTKGSDHEVDLILERDDGRIVAIEAKLGLAPTDADVKHLLWLRERLGPDLLDAVVVTAGSLAGRRPDGIGVVPLALIGP